MPLSEGKFRDFAVEQLPKLRQRRQLIREQIAVHGHIFFHIDLAVDDVPVDFRVLHVQSIGELRERKVAGLADGSGFFWVA